MPDFNEVYVRGNKCIAPNKRRTRCGHTNVSTREERDEVKPWEEKTEEQKVLHRFCTGHRKDKRRELTERIHTRASEDNVQRTHNPEMGNLFSSMGTQSPRDTIPSADDVQAQNPFLGTTPVQASQPSQPAYVSNPLPPPQPVTAIGEVNMSATEMQSRLPPLPPQHAALYRSYPPS